ncbi:hypothetical protein BDF19DRAFT_478886 [Syncephalis fuscata]|nr:hypothetical protein BDF19DRAFT_478886 [Syncephalis fuscata]
MGLQKYYLPFLLMYSFCIGKTLYVTKHTSSSFNSRSFCSKRHFSKVFLIFFRIAVGLVFLMEIATFTLIMLMVNGLIETINGKIFAMFDDYITFITPIISAIIFGVFTIWFTKSAYQLRKHPKAWPRFIQLIAFSVLGLVIYLIKTSLKAISKYNDHYSIEKSIKDVLISKATNEIIFVLYAFACMAVLGVYWPKPDNATITAVAHTPLAGLTTIGYETTMNDMDTKPVNNILLLAKRNKRPRSIILSETITVETITKSATSTMPSSYLDVSIVNK